MTQEEEKRRKRRKIILSSFTTPSFPSLSSLLFSSLLFFLIILSLFLLSFSCNNNHLRFVFRFPISLFSSLSLSLFHFFQTLSSFLLLPHNAAAALLPLQVSNELILLSLSPFFHCVCFSFLLLPLRVLCQFELCKASIRVPAVAALADCQFGFVLRGFRLLADL